MLNHIGSGLKNIEKQQNCTILFACESGSRAWGFASPNSDYDVRFIYLKPIQWYLTIDNKIDSINEMLPHDLDLSGWEIQKALRLFAKSNMPLYEWIGSPIVYSKNDRFLDCLKHYIPLYFNPKKSLHHYHNIADKTANEHLQTTSVNIKKLFYIIRPLLACLWIIKFKTMPPTVFHELLIEHEYLSPIHLSFIEDLLSKKHVTDEQGIIEIPQNMFNWIHTLTNNILQLAQNIEVKTTNDLSPLNELILEMNLPKADKG